MRFKNVLFDLDGTLTDPFEGISNSVLYSLEKMGINEESRESVRRFIGPPLVYSYMEFYNMTREQAETAVNYYREFYNPTGIYQNRIYDNMEELLQKLRNAGTQLFVATGKPQPFAERVLEHFGIDKYFTYVEGVTFQNAEVEKDFSINNIIGKFNLKKSETAMVGDRKYDILSANKVGITSIAIMHGFGSVEEFKQSNANVIVKDTAGLQDYLMNGDKHPCVR